MVNSGSRCFYYLLFMCISSFSEIYLTDTHICICVCIHILSCTYSLSNTFKYIPHFIKSRLLLSYANVLFIIKKENDVSLWVKLWWTMNSDIFQFKKYKYEKPLHGVTEYYVYIYILFPDSWRFCKHWMIFWLEFSWTEHAKVGGWQITDNRDV